MNPLIKKLIIEKEYNTTSKTAMIIILIILTINLIYNAYLTLKIYKFRKNTIDFSSLINPIYFSLIAFTLRILFSIIDYSIWLYTNGIYSLNGIYETLCFLFPLYFIFYIIYKQKLIKFPDKISSDRKIISLIVLLMLFLFFMSTYYINIQVHMLVIESIIFFIFSVPFIALIVLSYSSSKRMKSEISKLRLRIITTIFFYIFIYLIIQSLGFGLMSILYPSGFVSPLYYIILVILINLLPTMVSFLLYSLIFIPVRLRRVYGLYYD